MGDNPLLASSPWLRRCRDASTPTVSRAKVLGPTAKHNSEFPGAIFGPIDSDGGGGGGSGGGCGGDDGRDDSGGWIFG